MSIWDTVAAPIIAIVNKILPDKAAAAQAVAALQQMQLEGKLNDELLQLQAITVNQSDVNKVEAASPSLFVSGWRPAVGWVCVLGLVYSFLLQPILAWLGFVFKVAGPPVLDGTVLVSLLGSILGVGTLRTVDKIRGVG